MVVTVRQYVIINRHTKTHTHSHTDKKHFKIFQTSLESDLETVMVVTARLVSMYLCIHTHTNIHIQTHKHKYLAAAHFIDHLYDLEPVDGRHSRAVIYAHTHTHTLTHTHIQTEVWQQLTLSIIFMILNLSIVVTVGLICPSIPESRIVAGGAADEL
jgi:hypothetical protein